MLVRKPKGVKMNRIVENEINKYIGRYPDADELKSCIKYIENSVDCETTANELHYLVLDWVCAEMDECHHCGQYHLISEMLDVHGDHYCDEFCLGAEEQECYDMHEEARNEYNCMNR